MTLDTSPLQQAFMRLEESLSYLNSSMAASDAGLVANQHYQNHEGLNLLHPLFQKLWGKWGFATVSCWIATSIQNGNHSSF